MTDNQFQELFRLVTTAVTSINDVKSDVKELTVKVDGLEQRFDGLEQRFDGLEQRFDGLEQRFDGLEQRFDGLEQRFDGLEQKVDNLQTEFHEFRVETGENFQRLERKLDKDIRSLNKRDSDREREMADVRVDIDELDTRVGILEQQKAA